LPEVDPERAQLIAFRGRLDPLGDQPTAALLGEVDDPGDQRLADVVLIDLAHQTDVELHVVGTKLDDVAKTGEAGSGVIHGDPHIGPHARHRGSHRRVILDRHVLGHFEDHGARPTADAVHEALPLEQQVRRDVQAQPAGTREAGRCRQRCREAGRLEFEAKADGVGVGKSSVRTRTVVEPGQRLMADGHAGGEIDDRLERWLEGTGVQDRLEFAADLTATLPGQDPGGEEGRRHGTERLEDRQPAGQEGDALDRLSTDDDRTEHRRTRPQRDDRHGRR
jgi:hypothetical protein